MSKIYTFKNLVKIFISLTVLIFTSCEEPIQDKNVIIQERISDKSFEYKNNFDEYKKSVENSELSNLLNPERLKTDKKQIGATKIINTADSIIINYNQKRIEVFEEMKLLTDSLEVNASTTVYDIQMFKENLEKASTESRKNYLIDSTALSLNSQIVELLKSKCEYEIKNNKILFYDEDCLYNFSILNEELTLLATEGLNPKFKKHKKYIR